jgi:hypothetical protein
VLILILGSATGLGLPVTVNVLLVMATQVGSVMLVAINIARFMNAHCPETLAKILPGPKRAEKPVEIELKEADKLQHKLQHDAAIQESRSELEAEKANRQTFLNAYHQSNNASMHRTLTASSSSATVNKPETCAEDKTCYQPLIKRPSRTNLASESKEAPNLFDHIPEKHKIRTPSAFAC